MIGTIVSLAAFGIAVVAFYVWGKHEKSTHYKVVEKLPKDEGLNPKGPRYF